MKYDLIFYLAKKTGYCEKRLKPRLLSIGAEPHRIVSATSPVRLGEEVTHSLRLCQLVVIVGGLRSTYDDNLAVVLSRVFSNSGISLEHMRKLTAEGAGEGYIIRYQSQMILALPDEPDDIERLVDEKLLSYIRDKLA